jgi:hypothetical protein
LGPWATANYCRAGIKSLRGTVAFPYFPNKLFAKSLLAFSTIFIIYFSKTLQRLCFMENGFE